MSTSSQHSAARERHLPRKPRVMAGLCAAGAVMLSAGVAAAAYSTRVVSATSNQKLGKTVVVEAHGRTLYALSPETTHHLLCKSATCLQNWPPLTVRSAKLKLRGGPGVQGHLGVLRRSNGKLQVTLRGMPLYSFAGDSTKGQANGEGIMAFGGTWHAVRSEAHPSSTSMGAPAPAPAPTPAPTPTPSPSPPSYPY